MPTVLSGSYESRISFRDLPLLITASTEHGCSYHQLDAFILKIVLRDTCVLIISLMFSTVISPQMLEKFELAFR